MESTEGKGESRDEWLVRMLHESDDERERLRTEIKRLREALGFFLEDPRFDVAVGGNPIAVDQMLAKARAALAQARGDAARQERT